MSNPQTTANPKAVSPPNWLNSSRVASPFLKVASIRGEQMHQWLANSRVFHGMDSLYEMTLRPLRFAFARQETLHRVLQIIHLLATIAIFVLSTFAETDIIALAVVAATAILAIRLLLKPITVTWTVLDGLVTLFFLTAVASAFFSSFLVTSLIGLSKFAVFYLGYLNFRFLLSDDRRMLWILLGTLVALGCFESLIGLYQNFNRVESLATWQDPTINPELAMTRVFGTLKPYNPNLLAGFLIPCLATGIGLTLHHLFSRRWLLAAGLGLVALCTLMGVVLTGSRGGYLSLMGMFTIFFLLTGHLLWHEPELRNHHRTRALWLLTFLGTGAATALAVAFVPSLQHRVLSIFAMRDDSSNSYRINVWASTWKMIRDNWWIGIGPGNNTFKLVYGYYMTPGYNALSAYSIFLEMWAEQGIVGLGLFLLLLVTTGMRVLLNLYTSQPIWRKILLITLLAGIVASVIYGLFDTIWYRPSVNLLFWLMMAAMAQESEPGLAQDGVNG